MLYLWMPETNGIWHWSNGENWLQAESLDQLIQDLQLHQGKEAVVFFPSRHAQVFQQQIAKSHYKQLGADGVKYLLEEFVTLPIDHMKVVHHFHADQLTILGVAKTTVETWQHAMNLLPIKLVALLPDFLILPEPQEHQVILCNIDQKLLARESKWVGNSLDDLGLFLEFQPVETNYQYSGLTTEQLESLEAASSVEQRSEFFYQFQGLDKPKQHPFNILPKAKGQEQTVSGYWKACAVILLAIIVVQFSYDLLRWVKLRNVANQTAEQAIEQYKYWFGPSSRVNEQNIKSQFESHLRMSKQGDTQALSLLSRVGPILMQRQILAQQLNYDASTLTMALKAKSADDLQALTQQLNQQGFKAELGNVQADGGGAIGVVKIQ
ncbi:MULTISPECIES: type II secretion system protein GspL [Acinetobacter]|uniref:type II secretion system protein GspL n=1 Tax=Acinetobacter TaxID=469 RepID=UPI001478837B|nr:MULTISPECIES: type II secretion system protein GspL [Acinetobacter]MDQ9951419.1 type II secretion system protein GspL [Acinetobacter sp. 12966]